jgi:chromosome segregation ATPase
MQAQLRDKDQMVAMLVRQLADKDKQLPALLQAAVGDTQAELRALRSTLAEKERALEAVDDMQAELAALRAERDATVATAGEKQAQAAATATVAERRRDRDVDHESRRAGPVGGSVVSADNFHAGARVKWRYLGRDKNTGIVLSLGAGDVAVQWDNGTLVRLGIPNTFLTYA